MNAVDARTLVSYDQWANQRLLAASRALAPEESTRDRGASFGSIKATLVHILGGEWNWLRFWQGKPAVKLPARRPGWSKLGLRENRKAAGAAARRSLSSGAESAVRRYRGGSMAGMDTVVEANRLAVDDLIAAAKARQDAWTTPRAPGKWSPSQLVEHVARSLEESANEVRGVPSKFPNLPFFLRPVARTLLFNRVLRKGVFPRARTTRPFDPVEGPATLADGQRRLDQSVGAFIEACRVRAAGDRKVRSTVFGVVAVDDYARFQECHTRHHTRQLGT